MPHILIAVSCAGICERKGEDVLKKQMPCVFGTLAGVETSGNEDELLDLEAQEYIYTTCKGTSKNS